jgi:hypothetical protein
VQQADESREVLVLTSRIWVPPRVRESRKELLDHTARASVLEQALVSVEAARARLPQPTVRDLDMANNGHDVVDGHGPCPQDGGQPLRAAGVACPDARAERKWGSVGKSERFGLIYDGSNRHHGPEDLLFPRRRSAWHGGEEDGRD